MVIRPGETAVTTLLTQKEKNFWARKAQCAPLRKTQVVFRRGEDLPPLNPLILRGTLRGDLAPLSHASLEAEQGTTRVSLTGYFHGTLVADHRAEQS